jgi:hypothetical protein
MSIVRDKDAFRPARPTYETVNSIENGPNIKKRVGYCYIISVTLLFLLFSISGTICLIIPLLYSNIDQHAKNVYQSISVASAVFSAFIGKTWGSELRYVIDITVWFIYWNILGKIYMRISNIFM